MARPEGDPVRRADQLAQVRRLAHHLPDHGSDRGHQLQHPGRQVPAGRLTVGNPRGRLDHAAHRRQLAAEHVGLADLAAIEGEHDAVGDVVDVDHVEPEVRKGQQRKLAV
jgi:hypothetical protein